MKFFDYLAAFIDRQTGDYSARVAAGTFLSEMRSKHPDELNEWLMDHAREFIAIEISRHRRRERGRAFHRAAITSFSKAIEEFRAGDPQPLIDQRYVIDTAGTSRPLRVMDGTDCRFAAAAYTDRGNAQLAMAAFLNAVARRVGRKTVGEVLSAEQVDRIAQSLLGRSTAEAA